MAKSVKLLFGPMLIGAFFNSILFGVLALQMFIYYQTYRRDASWLRYFMLYLFIMETLNTAADIIMLYQPLVLEYAEPSATTYFPWLLAADPAVTVLISTPIQVFIAWRIWVISRSKYIPLCICLLATVAFSGGVWLTVTVIRVRTFSEKPKLHDPALVWLVPSAVGDAAITTALVYSLSKRKTGMANTDGMIDRIMRLTVQTGLITAVFAFADVICFLALPHTTLNFTWDFCLSKLYTNALLSTLNTRVCLNNTASRYRSSAVNRENVLFGQEDSDRPYPPPGSTRFSETRTGTNFEVVASSQFEMEPTKTTDEEWERTEWERSRQRSSTPINMTTSSTKRRELRDLEIGVAVIKEVRAM